MNRTAAPKLNEPPTVAKRRARRKAKTLSAQPEKAPTAAREKVPDLSAAITLGDAIDAYASAADLAEETAYRRSLYEKRNALKKAGLETAQRALKLNPRVKVIRWVSDLGGLVYVTPLCAETPVDPVFALWKAENSSLDFAAWFAGQPTDTMLGDPPNARLLLDDALPVDFELDLDPPTSARCTHRLAGGLLRRLLASERVAFALERGSSDIRRIEPREWRGEWQFNGELSRAAGGIPPLQLANVKIIDANATERVHNERGGGNKSNPIWPDIARKLKAKVDAMPAAKRPKSKTALRDLVRTLHPNENLKDSTIDDNIKKQLGQIFWDEF